MVSLNGLANLGFRSFSAAAYMDIVEAQAFGQSMQNAVTSQHNINQIAEATTAVAVAKIMALLK